MQGQADAGTAADFIIQTVRANPGEVTILALAALTNVAIALERDPEIAQLWRSLVVLGGAFRVCGNVNPAAEANIFGDPEAAEYVMTHTRGENTFIMGLDVTHSCQLTGPELASFEGAVPCYRFSRNIA